MNVHLEHATRRSCVSVVPPSVDPTSRTRGLAAWLRGVVGLCLVTVIGCGSATADEWTETGPDTEGSSDSADTSGETALDTAETRADTDSETSDATVGETFGETLEDSSPSDVSDVASDTPPLLAATYLWELREAAFAKTDTPDVAVYVPNNFDPFDKPGAVVFFHGFSNCVRNVIGDVDTACSIGGAKRSALRLATQLEATRANAILILPEIRFDVASGDPGTLAKAGQFRKFLHEVLNEKLGPLVGRPTLDVDDLERIVLSEHSGGYQAIAEVLTKGGVSQIRQIDLHDGLYGYLSTYDSYVRDGDARFDPTRTDSLRFATIYSASAGTDANSIAMAGRAKAWLPASSMLYDNTTATLVTETYKIPALFKRSGLGHNDVPRYYFQRLIEAAGFSTRK